MDEGIKRTFRRLNGHELLVVSEDEFAKLYSAIFGISYDEAAKELNGGESND